MIDIHSPKKRFVWSLERVPGINTSISEGHPMATVLALARASIDIVLVCFCLHLFLFTLSFLVAALSIEDALSDQLLRLSSFVVPPARPRSRSFTHTCPKEPNLHRTSRHSSIAALPIFLLLLFSTLSLACGACSPC
jgi:hypothetical protein